jgi:predicted HicB family RNase H-like nuclease
MATASFIATRVSPETKARFSSLANRQQLSESGLLKRLIDVALLAAPEAVLDSVTDPVEQVARDARLYVRLRPEDHVLLRERAAGRGMSAATYASILLRAHLRALRPREGACRTEARGGCARSHRPQLESDRTRRESRRQLAWAERYGLARTASCAGRTARPREGVGRR